MENRGTAGERGYDRQWLVVRTIYARQHPLCEDCAEHGLITQMTVVDHIVPLPEGPRLDPRNLRSLCNSHHTIKTQRDKHAGYKANKAKRPQEAGAAWIS